MRAVDKPHGHRAKGKGFDKGQMHAGIVVIMVRARAPRGAACAPLVHRVHRMCTACAPRAHLHIRYMHTARTVRTYCLSCPLHVHVHVHVHVRVPVHVRCRCGAERTWSPRI